MKYSLLIFLFVSNVFISCSQKKNDDPLQNPIVVLALANELTKPRTCDEGKTDPLLTDQWHLDNNGSLYSAVMGEDAKVKPVWQQGNRGDGILISVVDDGLDEVHEDLKAAIHPTIKGLNYAIGSYTSSQHTQSSSAHGTSVAGVAAGRGGNGIGISGAAPCAQIVGRGILEGGLNTLSEAEAMTKDTKSIHVSNNSWGAADNTGQLFPSNSTWQAAIEEGLKEGRDGKGTIYLWAAGNGGKPSASSSVEIDNSNYDGQANFYGVMAICGVGVNGKRAFYSEKGANLWVCAHTQGDDGTQATVAITTTDPTGEAGYNNGSNSNNLSNPNYTKLFNGTSSAAPLASGVVALLLKSKPELGWRDVREILAKSARKNDPTDSDWTTNAAGYNINHKYGFGTIDADKAVDLAKNWTLIASLLQTDTTNETTLTNIPDNDLTGIEVSTTYSGNIKKLEFLDINVTSDHTYHGDLTFTLTSPSGTKSVLSEQHICYSGDNQTNCNGFTGTKTFRFSSARHLGEDPNGTWKLKAVDGYSGDTGKFKYSLKFYGRAN